MFRDHHFDRVQEMFADQFEPDGDDFLYRRSMKGAPIRVSRAERDAFLADFGKRFKYAKWAIVPATLLLIGLLVVFLPDADGPSFELFIYIGTGLIIASFMIGHYWAWNAPARQLVRRPELGKARPRAEMRRIMLARMTYRQLATAAAGMAALLFMVSEDTDLLHGWGRFWLGFSAVVFGGVAFQAFRKWRFDKQQGHRQGS
jgi:uncharacterized membrane protein